MKRLSAFLILLFFISCSENKKTKITIKQKINTTTDFSMNNLGIGPIKKDLKLPLGIDKTMALKGKAIYFKNCVICHSPESKLIGPAPKGIFERRNPAWVMNMILNPHEMIFKDSTARKLAIKFDMNRMSKQVLKKNDARAILEYFRTF